MTEKNSVTLRIDKNVFDKLKREADTKEISFNTLANGVLRRYLSWSDLIPKAGIMPVRKALISNLMERFTEDEISSIARTISKNSRDIWLLVKGVYSEESILELIEDWTKMANFPYNQVLESRKRKFIIQHDLGKKWSQYIGVLVRQMFHEVGTKVEVELTDSTVVFILSHLEEKSHVRHF